MPSESFEWNALQQEQKSPAGVNLSQKGSRKMVAAIGTRVIIKTPLLVSPRKVKSSSYYTVNKPTNSKGVIPRDLGPEGHLLRRARRYQFRE